MHLQTLSSLHVGRRKRLRQSRAGRDRQVDAGVIGGIVAGQRDELEQEIAGLKADAERVAEEARELAGEAPFRGRLEARRIQHGLRETPQPRGAGTGGRGAVLRG